MPMLFLILLLLSPFLFGLYGVIVCAALFIGALMIANHDDAVQRQRYRDERGWH